MSDLILKMRPIDEGSLVYTIHPAAHNGPNSAKIMEHRVLTDTFSVHPVWGPNHEKVSYCHVWFPVTSQRRIIFGDEAESGEYGKYFAWEEVATQDDDYSGFVPQVFCLESVDSAWYRTFDEAKSALFVAMLRIADTDIRDLRERSFGRSDTAERPRVERAS